MDGLEETVNKTDSRLDRVEIDVGTMSNTMTAKFQEVLGALSSLHEMQNDNKRYKAAEAPVPMQS